MTWAVITAFLRTKVGRYLMIGFAITAGLLGLRMKWQGEGEAKAERRARDEAERRVEAGREAVRGSRGLDPDEQLRRNDGRW